MSGEHSIEYRDVPGFPGYRVSSDGHVWSCWKSSPRGGELTDRWRRMKASVQKKRTAGRAYHYLNLRRPGELAYQTFRVHRLILEAFVGPCPEGMEARHLNGNPADNRLDNLEWATPAVNRADVQAHGHHIKGERHPGVKLTESEVREIRARHAAGERQAELAVAFGVTFSNISAIVYRRSWTHVD